MPPARGVTPGPVALQRRADTVMALGGVPGKVVGEALARAIRVASPSGADPQPTVPGPLVVDTGAPGALPLSQHLGTAHAEEVLVAVIAPGEVEWEPGLTLHELVEHVMDGVVPQRVDVAGGALVVLGAHADVEVVESPRGLDGDDLLAALLLDQADTWAAELGAARSSFRERLDEAIRNARLRERIRLEELRRSHRAELGALRSSTRFRLGEALVSAAAAPAGLRRLPRALVQLYRQRPRPPEHQTAVRIGTGPRIGIVGETGATSACKPHGGVVPLHPEAWRAQVRDVDLVVVRSGALEPDQPWGGARGAATLSDLLRWSRRGDTPAVLWIGSRTATVPPGDAFDAVVTTAANLARPGAADLELQPAIDPSIHNPVGTPRTRLARACFYWPGHAGWDVLRDLDRLLLEPVAALGVLDVVAEHPPKGRASERPPWGAVIEATGPELSIHRRYAVSLLAELGGCDHPVGALGCGSAAVVPAGTSLPPDVLESVLVTSSPAETSGAVELLLGDPDGRDRQAHLAHRAVHAAHTIGHRLDAIAGHVLGSSPRSLPLVSVICVSNRPALLERCLDTYRRQTYPSTELLFVTNSMGFDRQVVDRAVAAIPGGRTLHVDEDATLSECLNLAIDIAEGEYFAKLDDDDGYGDDYLSDLMLTFGYSGAAVAGKLTYFAYLASRDLTILRMPGREHRLVEQVCGGTLVVDRRALGPIRFVPVPGGADSVFLDDCVAAGLGIYSADRFNFVQNRSADPAGHTWTFDEDRYVAAGAPVGPGRQEGRIFV